MTDPARPVEPIPLEYDVRGSAPWRPLIRILAIGAAAQGATILADNGYLIFGAVTRGQRLGAGEAWVDVAAVGLVLAAAVVMLVGGLAVLIGSRAGPVILAVAEPCYAALILAHGGWNAWAWTQRMAGTGQGWWIAGQLLFGSVPSCVLPLTLWALFRRPDVRAAAVNSAQI